MLSYIKHVNSYIKPRLIEEWFGCLYHVINMLLFGSNYSHVIRWVHAIVERSIFTLCKYIFGVLENAYISISFVFGSFLQI